jgi:acyl-CoA hydrolase
MGIGSVPDAALSQLTNHKNLGIHTEMFSVSWLKTWDLPGLVMTVTVRHGIDGA